MPLQLDPLDHHFDPEGQAPTLWARISWSTDGDESSLLRLVTYQQGFSFTNIGATSHVYFTGNCGDGLQR
jgi:hypothetical protein